MPESRPGLLRRIQYGAEYAVVRTISWAVGLMPECLAVRAGILLGLAFWAVAFPRRRSRGGTSSLRCRASTRRPSCRRLVREVFVQIGLTGVESLWARKHVNSVNILDRFPVDGTDEAQKALAEGRGVLAFTPHLGNWELFGGCMAVRMGGLCALARPTNNPLVERYTTRLRQDLGIDVLSTRDGVRPMIAALRAGKPLAILIDQHVNRAFVPATFFGRPAATTAVVASLGLRLNAPVFAAYSLREGRSFRHHGHVEGPIELVRTGDNEADPLANTQRFNDLLEQIVRRRPEQWLWTHRRWKLADRARGKQERKEITITSKITITNLCSPGVAQCRISSRELVNKLGSPRVLVVGDYMLDRYLWGSVERISPEGADPRAACRPARLSAGRSGQRCRKPRRTRRAGRSPSVSSGTTKTRASAQAAPRRRNGDRGPCRSPSRPTTLKTRMVARSQQMLRVDEETTAGDRSGPCPADHCSLSPQPSSPPARSSSRTTARGR